MCGVTISETVFTEWRLQYIYHIVCLILCGIKIFLLEKRYLQNIWMWCMFIILICINQEQQNEVYGCDVNEKHQNLAEASENWSFLKLHRYVKQITSVVL